MAYLWKHSGNAVPHNALKVRGEFHASASTGGALNLFDQTAAAVTLSGKDRVLVTSITVVTDTGADLAVFFGSNQTIGAGKTIARGTVGANGGIVREFRDLIRGPRGEGIRCKAGASGVIDAQMTGYVIRDRS